MVRGGLKDRARPAARVLDPAHLSSAELAQFCGYPLGVTSMRWAPPGCGRCNLTKDGIWARPEALESLRWLFLEAPLTHGLST